MANRTNPAPTLSSLRSVHLQTVRHLAEVQSAKSAARKAGRDTSALAADIRQTMSTLRVVARQITQITGTRAP